MRNSELTNSTYTMLSFFSGHASMAGTLIVTAAYLAWENLLLGAKRLHMKKIGFPKFFQRFGCSR